ncbi:MAG: bifunctional DNA-formamidopyrimidine glycosylase/DNA-(apurinic or apyrimidinic site) lyase [Deltaproteobacteria bacterium]|nr:bifunctional DNA-formamidopyrimidine glycosylase/DNA-(apurinic or apyrimidinic site) lyase [Deltaproteobacteria bacterium]MBI3389675.1 bifunctional DNA-formamidopyrimidine glycosylase/DNA-(apurinic or apyrimidinic site) lyase [Deltaproteobacteria bacterium]
MPELPEVETVRRSLLPRVVGRRIVAVKIRERRLRRPIQRDFAARLIGRRIDDVERRAKYLLFHLDNGDRVLAHLGMSGALLVRDAIATAERHDHVRVRLHDGTELVFNDPRRFGLLEVGSAADVDEWKELTVLGPDPLDPAFTAEQFDALLRRCKRAIKNLLIDQAVLGGVGNIYANEALFRARIRPTRRSQRIRRTEVEPLFDALRAVLNEAVDLGGSSISDYRDGDGRPGYFQLRLRVYDRSGEPCLDCGATIRRVVQSGRGSFYCPRCQR